jgi:hypothetical protein
MSSFLDSLLVKVLIISGAAAYRWLDHSPWNSIVAGILCSQGVRVAYNAGRRDAGTEQP